MATLVVDSFHDYRAETLSNITLIDVANNGYGRFMASQFDGVQISPSVVINGDASNTTIEIDLDDNIHTFSAANITLNNWTGGPLGSGDVFDLYGTVDADTLTGTSYD